MASVSGERVFDDENAWLDELCDSDSDSDVDMNSREHADLSQDHQRKHKDDVSTLRNSLRVWTLGYRWQAL